MHESELHVIFVLPNSSISFYLIKLYLQFTFLLIYMKCHKSYLNANFYIIYIYILVLLFYQIMVVF